MATILKIANSAQELEDVFHLRHQVYVIEDKKFGGKPLPGLRIVDHFDALPGTANIIAYEDEVAVGTIRITRELGAGLPAEEYYDFSAFKQECAEKHSDQTVVTCGGMLAIREGWRNRRDVIQALFKLAIGLMRSWNTTNMIATVNHETVSLYHKLGFSDSAGAFWVEEIDNYVTPMSADFSTIYDWAFGGLLNQKLDQFWLDYFSGQFERILLSPGEVLFNQNDNADAVYIVDQGWISIVKHDGDGQELNLANLPQGALFGETALIAEQARSASAIASVHTEVIRLSIEDFKTHLAGSQKGLEMLLKMFAGRIIETDELAMVLAYAPQSGRVKYALDKIKASAIPHRKNEKIKVAKYGPKELARNAGVREFEVRQILEIEKVAGKLDYSEKSIRFNVS